MKPTGGGCLCGATRYEVTGAATHPTLCHCPSCRRASGAPLVAWVTFAREHFRRSGAPPASYESSPGVTRTFCARCGTPLTYARDDLPGEIDVTVATLDDPEATPPADHTWDAERLAWLELGDDLPRFPRARSDG